MIHRLLHVSLSFALVTSTCSLAVIGCGDAATESLDGQANAATADDPHGSDEASFPPPNDDPALGGDIDADLDPAEPDPEAAEDIEVAQINSTQSSGGSCVRGGFYCGGDKMTGNARTLYRCNGPGTPTLIKVCKAGCSVNPGRDDSCKVAPGTRVAAPVPGRVVTYPFGVRNSRYAAGYHTGDDYAAPVGSSAVAIRGGTVRWSNDYGGAYGKWIGLDADNGRTYVYCHLSARAVSAGTRVVAGQRLGRVGATGNVTGPHLHFEDHPRGPFVYAQVRKPSW
jgi:murein DD-endopeptidase MepM/ murein hydrolase activator NlpD